MGRRLSRAGRRPRPCKAGQPPPLEDRRGPEQVSSYLPWPSRSGHTLSTLGVPPARRAKRPLPSAHSRIVTELFPKSSTWWHMSRSEPRSSTGLNGFLEQDGPLTLVRLSLLEVHPSRR